MARRPGPEDVATNSRPAQAPHVLLVVRDGVVTTHPLPSHGEVSVGRSPENEIVIDDASISRRHARFHVGPPLCVEDLGSANGTRLQQALVQSMEAERAPSGETAKTADDDRALVAGERVELAAGNVIRLGAVTVVVQRADARNRRAVLWPHAQFEARLADACRDAERTRTPFSVLRLSAPDVAASAVQGALAERAPADAQLAVYGPSEYEVLLPRVDADAAAAIAERMRSAFGPSRSDVVSGVATYPNDGPYAEALLSCACARLGRSAVDNPPQAVVRSPAMVELYGLVERVAQTDISVLVVGETGVGKEVISDHLWRVSARADKPMLRLNCAALSETLLESELFGHERGAFTGAIRAKAGLLESANGGIVFLDEIGELPAATQAKLLRVIEERRVLRVGALRPIDVDVRFVSATHRDLEAEVAADRFREDLYYRINGFSLRVPPLRERPEEIEPLVRAFVADFVRRYRRGVEPIIVPEVFDVLRGHHFPGNVRELRNVVERALVLCGAGPLGPEHLPMDKLSPSRSRSATTLVPPPNARPTDPEEARIVAALDQCAGNQTRAAKVLGISRATLVARLERYAIRRPRK